MGEPFRVGFCVSGMGRLFRSAVVHRHRLGVVPALAVLGGTADAELDEFCRGHQCPAVRLPAKPKEAVGDAIGRALLPADLSLVALTFDHLIPAAVVREYRGRMINYHPSLLPAFPGMRAVGRCVAGGARFAGATIHEVSEGVDDGPVVAQCVIGLRPADTPESVGARVYGPGRLMYLQAIRWYAEGRVSKDEAGRAWVAGATYGEFPVSPAVELSFPD